MPTIDQARAWYEQADAVHGFDHVLRVYHLAERLAMAEGADVEIVRAAALLHDVKDAAPAAGQRLDHHLASAEFAEQVLAEEGWPAERIAAVAHCIRAHRYRNPVEPPQTREAQVLFDADKLDVLGAIGAARVIAYAAQAGQPILAEPSPQFIETGQHQPGEAHSAYHEFLFKLRKVRQRLYTTSAQAIATDREHYLQAFFDRMQAESRGEL